MYRKFRSLLLKCASTSMSSKLIHSEKPFFSKMVVDETAIKPENRIPRVTAATWKYESGAVGSFTHVVGLQGTNYSCELEVFADGYSLK